MAGGKRLLPGNLTLSNVPGPADARSYAGFRQLHNYPVPIIGSGRFLNITSRRSGGNLDMGVIADAKRLPTSAALRRCSWPRSTNWRGFRSEEHTSELQSLMRISYAVFFLKKKMISQHQYYSQLTQTITAMKLNTH